MLGVNLIGELSYVTEGVTMEHDSEDAMIVGVYRKKRPRRILGNERLMESWDAYCLKKRKVEDQTFFYRRLPKGKSTNHNENIKLEGSKVGEPSKCTTPSTCVEGVQSLNGLFYENQNQ